MVQEKYLTDHCGNAYGGLQRCGDEDLADDHLVFDVALDDGQVGGLAGDRGQHGGHRCAHGGDASVLHHVGCGGGGAGAGDDAADEADQKETSVAQPANGSSAEHLNDEKESTEAEHFS